MTTYTSISRLPVMTPFDPAVSNSWGSIINAMLPLVEQTAAGWVQISLTGVAAHTLTVANDAPDEARMAFLLFSGASTALATVTLPAVSRIGWVSNASTHIVTLTTGSGTTLNVPVGATYMYQCDGTNIIAINLTPAAAITAPSTITLPNNNAYRALDTGGTARSLMVLDAANNLTLQNTAAGTVRVLNKASTQSLMTLDDSGNMVVETSLTVPKLSGFGTTPVGAGMDFYGAAAPSGWVFAAGQQISRTTYAALFAVIGTTFGVGNGTTTFNVPDKRGRISLPLDNLGGSAASRVTVFAATVIGATGGDQNAAAHSHGVTDPGHNHTISQSAHTHALGDPGHAHGVVDPGHVHQYNNPLALADRNTTTTGAFGNATQNSGIAATGISISASATGMTLGAASATVANVAAVTGITVNSAQTGGAANMPPVLACTYIIYAGV